MEKEEAVQEIEEEIKKAKGDPEDFEIEITDNPAEEAKDVAEEQKAEEAQKQAKRTEPEVTVAMDSGDKMPKQESTADKILKNRMRRMGAAGLIGSVAGLPIASALMKDRDQA